MEQKRMTRSPATSFIVRVWSDDEGAAQVRGEIEHVGTGEKRFFLDYSSLTNLIEAWRKDLAPTAR
jgi:hypothetical protein